MVQHSARWQRGPSHVRAGQCQLWKHTKTLWRVLLFLGYLRQVASGKLLSICGVISVPVLLAASLRFMEENLPLFPEDIKHTCGQD